MTAGYQIALFAGATCASALGGTLGMASGVFIVPILTAFCGVPIHDAIGASLVSVIACSCACAPTFLCRDLVNLRLAIILEVATTLGATLGVLLSGAIPVHYLYALFAAILIVSAVQMQARRDVTPLEVGMLKGGNRLDGTYRDEVSGQEVDYRVERLPLGMSFMFVAGLISALLGIGSGVLKIPAMDTALRLPIKVSSATSNFMIGVTAAASAGAYFLRGDIVSSIVGPVALGSVLGATIGARLLISATGDRIRNLFVIVLIGLAAQMLFAAFKHHVGRSAV